MLELSSTSQRLHIRRKGQAGKVNTHQFDNTEDPVVIITVTSYRPSNTRIRELEAENARLRGSLIESASHSPRQAGSDPSRSPHQHFPIINEDIERVNTSIAPEQSDLPLEDSTQTLPPTSPAPPYHASTDVHDGHFHGPSSALFDQFSSGQGSKTSLNPVRNAFARNQLIAEATRQRE